ncbi:tol-pal system YbgF family protein [Streptomyces sp. NPDC057697]|uniref:tetratricopeptide repeat protein n=1 Tax=Streptomyces sp. NPDC057697 TaxID=3346219 RepID=UPI00369B3C24
MVGPPPPGSGLRAVAVALLNLSGLGLGYALMRCWVRMVLCWAATGALLWAVLPAEPEGAAGWVVVAGLLALVLAAGDGARAARRRAVGGSWRPVVAAGAGLVLLAVPAGGVVAYGSARDEAVEQMLLDRLDRGDRSVGAASGKSFAQARGDYEAALAVYRDLGRKHPGSRAGKLVPKRLDAYYEAVSAPYRRKEFCEAVAPLTYLRTLPRTVGPALLGDLAGYPDGPLAASLYACGVSKLGTVPKDGRSGDELSELLRTFPRSAEAGQVGPAVTRKISEQSRAVRGNDPCAARDTLRRLRTAALALPDKALSGLAPKADRGIQDGGYACGVAQFEAKRFGRARLTMTEFAASYKKDKRVARARDIAIAAEIADTRAAAGRHLPPSGSPGGTRMELVISNDAPDGVEILYTGPVTGKTTIKGCGSCSARSGLSASLTACKTKGKNYPRTTLWLPAGEYHFLYKHRGGSSSTIVSSYADGSKIQPGYRYTGCTYVTTSPSFGLGPADPVKHV